MTRRWSIVACILVALVAALAGCSKKTDTPGDGGNTTSSSTPPTGSTTTSTTPPTGGGGGAPKPSPAPVTDKGTIQGPFAKEWTVNVPAVSPKSITVNFNLTGAQPGAPATARIVLQFLDPDGKVLKSATLGLGGAPNVAWSFTAADAPNAGDYKLKATTDTTTAPAPGGLPSGGVANYDLVALVEY